MAQRRVRTAITPSARILWLFSIVFVIVSRPAMAGAEAPPARATTAAPTGEAQASDETRRLTAQVESLTARQRELEAQVSALSATIDRWSALRGVDDEMRMTLEALRGELAQLRRRQASETTPRFQVGFDRGLYFSVGAFRLTLNGWTQARYVGEANSTMANVSTFQVRSAALATTFELGRWALGRLELDLGSTYIPAAPFAEPESWLREAFIEVRPVGWLAIRGGRLRAPLGRQRLVARMDLADPERNLATLAFTSPQDLGVLVAASPWDGRLLVEAAVTNGEQPWAMDVGRNGNLDLRYTFRVVGSPLGMVRPREGDFHASSPARFSLGAAASYDLVPQDKPLDPAAVDRDNVEVVTATAEATFAWRWLALQAEYFYRREHHGGQLATKEFHGAYLQAQATPVPRWLLLALHGAYAEPHALGATAALPGGQAPGFEGGRLSPKLSIVDMQIPVNAWETGGTAVLYLASPNLKLQLAYAWRRSLMTIGDVDTHLVEVQLAAGF